MFELNQTERKSLILFSGLLVLGAGVRVSTGPGEARFAWTPAQGSEVSADQRADLTATRKSVQEELVRDETASRPLGADEKIDPNTAGLEQLRRLPGVGPTRAAAILRERSVGGPFTGPESLSRVPGIGPATAARLAAHLTLSPVQPAPAGPLSINRAEIKDLEQIPRIGPVLARRIVADRNQQGSFRRPEDLLRVKGIGAATLDRLRPYLRFD
ncbi:MAG: ComEA family DNA-binding protein [Gemmatimonadota bacterium]